MRRGHQIKKKIGEGFITAGNAVYCMWLYLYLNIIKIDSCEGDGLRQEFQMTWQVVQIFCGIRLLKELGSVTYNIDVVEIKILNSWIYKSVKM